MKFLLGLVAILAVLFVGGFLFSGLTPAVVTQTEMTRDIEPPKEQVKTPPPVAVAPAETIPAEAQAVTPTPEVAPATAPTQPPIQSGVPTAPVTSPATSPVAGAE